MSDAPTPPGKGLRVAAWVSLGIGAAIAAAAVSSLPPRGSSFDLLAFLTFALGLAAAAGCGILALLCSIAGAAKAANAVSDKRLAVVLPMWCSLAFLLILAGCLAAGRR